MQFPYGFGEKPLLYSTIWNVSNYCDSPSFFSSTAVILFMSIEKNLTSGLTAGGVKG